MHSLIVGMTRMGKTTLAQLLAREYQKLGYKVAVYTVPGTTDNPPRADPRWNFADYVTLDRQAALERFKASYKVMWFFDEANRTVGKYDPEMEATATSGSLHGHTCHYLAQRTATFNRTVREQCSRLYMFRQGPDDCGSLYQDWGHEEILQGHKLAKGQAIYCTTEPGSIRKIDLKLR